ncbi:hypothetical protein [Pseudonocardia sp.]|uniref:hypothetical protein n=1 Tax=Pseudonocardia sp. TaxID=60912 RepID=UPI003D0F9CCB
MASLLRAIGLFIVAVLVLFIVLTVLDANPANPLTQAVTYLANLFDLGLSDLFVQPDPKVAVALNYGIAAVVWLVITTVVTRLVRRF